MLKMTAAFIFALQALVVSVSCFGGEPWKSIYPNLEKQNGKYSKTQIYRVDLDSLHPSQAVVGYLEVESRANEMEKMGKGEFRRYLKEHIGTVVIGPDEEYWLIDGHHVARATELVDGDEILVKVQANWSGLSRKDFFARMIKAKWMWLYDGKGNPINPEDLPKSISKLRDDPFRGLAWRVRKAGGFEKTSIPFAEFEWGKFFRSFLTADELEKKPEASLNKALDACKTPKAKGLPGYNGGNGSKIKAECEAELE